MSYDYGDFWHKCKALKFLYKGHTNLSMIENLGSDVMRVVDLLVFNWIEVLVFILILLLLFLFIII